MGKTTGVCKVCGEPIHKSRARGRGWMHNRVGNHDHLAVKREDRK